jgi:hypothetical protein
VQPLQEQLHLIRIYLLAAGSIDLAQKLVDPLLQQAALLLQLLEPRVPLFDLSEKFGFARVAHQR